MGTPKDRKQFSLTPPSAPETLNTLKRAADLSKLPPTPEALSGIFHEMKSVLGSVVRLFDKLLADTTAFPGAHLPRHFREERGLVLFDNFGSGFISLALQRSGKWFLSVFDKDPKVRFTGKVDEDELGYFVFNKIQRTMAAILNEELKFLENILVSAVIVDFALKCHTTVMQVVLDQEKKLQTLRERVNLVGQLAEALDPIQSGLRTAILPSRSIFEEHERGTNVVAGTYLATVALEPFWEIIRRQSPDAGAKYVLSTSETSLNSLQHFSRLIHNLLSDIERAKNSNREGARDLLGYHGGRLPLIPEEIAILKDVARSLA